MCFLLYLIPGLPKDILCYLFGLSPMPFWVFAVASTLGRLPGTWILSAQGARTATGHYMQTALMIAIVAAAAIPLYASHTGSWLDSPVYPPADGGGRSHGGDGPLEGI